MLLHDCTVSEKVANVSVLEKAGVRAHAREPWYYRYCTIL